MSVARQRSGDNPHVTEGTPPHTNGRIETAKSPHFVTFPLHFYKAMRIFL